ncbi:MAG TPA: D-alanyl-D-alanine carboxypeptidase/D-alanyl-D-alanine-endopeptidase [Bacteroidales bacterium]|nr:D-alanyl-D-alanine carboxypeptidase/D-alanyl-D-alanine-endopeptidase [Bacteroidales bacterium]
MRKLLFLIFFLISIKTNSQTTRFEIFLTDTVMTNASVSFLVADADIGNVLFSYNPKLSLIPASTMKLVTSSAALELLGPAYTFRTSVGYTGTVNRSGRLYGNIVIKGGGDPTLGSEYFSEYYNDFVSGWVDDLKKYGIRKVRGKVITDDSYYDYEPVAPRWLWEDIGVYYGAGVYGLSVFDNSCKIRVKSSGGSSGVEILDITPDLHGYKFTNRLISSGSEENWYVYSAPYSTQGWLSGTVPSSEKEIILDASIPDPPLLLAEILNEKLDQAGIRITGKPATSRLEPAKLPENITILSETISPLLTFIIDILNKESVNLYAEHLVKELGKQIKGRGTTAAGLNVIREFLDKAGVDTTGLFIEDGSGLSSRNGLNAEGLVKLLIYLRARGRYFPEFYSSLPEAGYSGTLSQYFTDEVFVSNLKAKSGSMTRVRCYAGYMTSRSGKNLVFTIMVNNFQGTSRYIITHIEDILKEIIFEN